jgi:quercetin dioxygenase-like cupin family protein
MVVLIKGRFQIDLSDASRELNTEGDYVVWGPGIDHCWRAIEDSVVLTVRWPSLS